MEDDGKFTTVVSSNPELPVDGWNAWMGVWDGEKGGMGGVGSFSEWFPSHLQLKMQLLRLLKRISIENQDPSPFMDGAIVSWSVAGEY